MTDNVAIHWFRQDLRLLDNPSLIHATKNGKVLPIYILDDENAGQARMGAASRWWLYHALCDLNKSLSGNLHVYNGDPKTIIPDLIRTHEVKHVSWNRCYEPWRMRRDEQIEAKLTANGVGVQIFNGSLLWEPWEVVKADKTPYRVFTSFYRKGCLNAAPPRKPLSSLLSLEFAPEAIQENTIANLDLLPKIPWDKKMVRHWHIGEEAAQKALIQFLDNGIHNYKEGRNFPAKDYVSHLSPYLHFGHLSPNQVWYAARFEGTNDNVEHFCSELGWREFSYNILYYNHYLPTQNLQIKFDRFPWNKVPELLRAWQKGQTGIPIVDAGMRELWQTGYMHNRVRMIVASFLAKNLRMHWHHGERWFWDCLVDADLAINSASWQWVAGSGMDAAPYFRIFNPVTQGQKFDADGIYTRHFVPELAKLSTRFLFNPWEAPKDMLSSAGIVLGKDYPEPIVDLRASRQEALDAFASIKNIK